MGSFDLVGSSVDKKSAGTFQEARSFLEGATQTNGHNLFIAVVDRNPALAVQSTSFPFWRNTIIGFRSGYNRYMTVYHTPA